MEEKLVRLNVISAKGHTEIDETPKEALATLKELVSKQNKWVYIDGVARQDTEGITLADLIEADNITLTNTLVGG